MKVFQDVIGKFGDRVFAVDGTTGLSTTYSDFLSLSLSLGSTLRERGVQQGDRVAVLLPNSLEFALTYFACLHVGAVAVPLNTALHQRNRNYILQVSRPAILIHSPGTRALAGPHLDSDTRLRGLCLKPGNEKEESYSAGPAWTVEDLRGDGERGLQPFGGCDEERPFTITFTSGTTALPKGILHSVGNYVRASRMFNGALGVVPEDRFYHILSMSYMAGLLNLLIAPFLAGASVVISPPFDARLVMRFWNVPMKYGVNRFWLVPSLLAMLLKVDRDKLGVEYGRNRVKDAFVGTAPLSSTSSSMVAPPR